MKSSEELWLDKQGPAENTTKFLANRINPPAPEMHELFAQKLYDTIMLGQDKAPSASEDAMFEE